MLEPGLTLMGDEFSFDVFLSHSSKDKAVVRAVAELLKKDGLRVWLDDWEIRPGDHVQAKIEEGLEQSRVLVLCMSAQAFGSDWAQLEAGTFRFRDPLNKERRFIPLRLDEAPIKGALVQFLYVNWLPADRELEYPKLLEACRPPAKPPVAASRAAPEQTAEKAIQLDYDQTDLDYAFSSDGKRVLAGGLDRKVRLWDIETGRCLRVFKGHKDAVESLSWSADQSRALSVADGARLWDVETGRCMRVFKGHTKTVWCAAWSSDQRCAVTGSSDETVRLWDVLTGRCLRVFEGHTDAVRCVAWGADLRRILSGSADKTVRLWDLETRRCLRVFEGHAISVWSVAWSADQRRALSGSADSTVRLWDVETGRCLRVLEGHEDSVKSVVWSADGRRALSGSEDNNVRLWDLETGHCLRVLEGHSIAVRNVAWSTDQRHAFSGDYGGSIRVWDLSEFVMVAGTPEAPASALPPAPDQVQYTNAKVLLVGETGAGKTGLTERLAHDTFTPSYSTSGAWSTQWQMKDLPLERGWEREVWLWDFGGQADQRLIHQLYVDRAALLLLVFNADRDVVLPGLREWQQALSRSVPTATPTYLVAGRIDVGFRFDREKVRAFAHQHHYRYFETSANDGRGCPELRRAIQAGIPWNQLERRTSPTTWKLLNDEILKLRDEGQVLFPFKELRETLRQRLPGEAKFTDTELETVVGLLDGPGVVKELGFGSYILLRPEWINAYAQAIIRTLRSDVKSLGCLPVQSIAQGKLIFQTQQASGEIVEEKRLGSREEPIVLQAMEEALLERKLCLRQEGNLVFPSYCGIEKPVGPVPLKYFISYTFGGFLDDVYATLVVKLVYCGAFKLKELWRDAADFDTLAEQRTMGIKLLRNDDGRGTLLVHFGKGVPIQEQVIFANYIHEHLVERATEPQRLRFHVCPHCDTPVKDSEESMRRLEERGEKASILCQRCEKRVPLWDSLEQRFASEAVKKRVALLQSQERVELDSRRKGKLLALEVAARITSADQKCFEIPGVEDEGLDMEVEFTDTDGRGSGKRLYLQLKAGNSYLERRKDGAEIFRIKKQGWVKYWLKQDRPVVLVIGTFPEDSDELRGGGKERFADIRWMEVSELLRSESKDGKQPVKQIVFEGQRLDAMAVRGWRADALRGTSN
jgi:small GTP-binding protein